jgi:hypothetical protein
MFKRIAGAGLAIACLTAASAHAACGALPYTLTNGYTADASQVMADLNCLLINPGFTGPVGINTTGPSASLDIAGADNVYTTKIEGASGKLAIFGHQVSGGTNYGTTLIGLNPAETSYQPLSFIGAPILLNPGAGYIGIGTTSPGAKFEADSTDVVEILQHQGGSTSAVYTNYVVTGVVIGSVTNDGSWSGVHFNTTSDRRLKENIAPTVRGLDTLSKMNVDDFNYIADPNKSRVQGLIAQELYDVYPEAVTKGGPDPKLQPWQIDYSRLTPLLIKAMQDLKATNDQLAQRVSTLEKTVAGLQAQAVSP